MADIVDDLHDELCKSLEGIKDNWKNPDKIRLTLVVRDLVVPDANVVIGDDDLDEAIGVICNFQGRDPKTYITKG